MGGPGSGSHALVPYVPDKDRKPWDRQDGETTKSWEAFVLYRDQGLERTLARVAKQLKKSTALLGRWSSQYGWKTRVREWDRECDRRARQAHLREIEKMKRRHLRDAKLLQDIAYEGFKRRLVDAKDGDNLSADQQLRLHESGVKLERLNMGEPGEINEQRVQANVTIYFPQNDRSGED